MFKEGDRERGGGHEQTDDKVIAINSEVAIWKGSKGGGGGVSRKWDIDVA